jgi:hypothetical protein
MLRAYLDGQRVPDEILAKITSPSVAPRHRCMMHEVAAEILAMQGDQERALEEIERAVQLPFVNVAWLDGCPLFEPIRPGPRFAAARAIAAARAASLWSNDRCSTLRALRGARADCRRIVEQDLLAAGTHLDLVPEPGPCGLESAIVESRSST